MNQTIIQIPISKKLRDRAVKIAENNGFSSLQEVIRIFLNKFAEREIYLSFISPMIELSDKNDERYAKIISQVKNGKIKTKKFFNADDLIEELNK